MGQGRFLTKPSSPAGHWVACLVRRGRGAGVALHSLLFGACARPNANPFRFRCSLSSGSRIRLDGCKALCEVLKTNKTLTSVELRSMGVPHSEGMPVQAVGLSLACGGGGLQGVRGRITVRVGRRGWAVPQYECRRARDLRCVRSVDATRSPTPVPHSQGGP